MRTDALSAFPLIAMLLFSGCGTEIAHEVMTQLGPCIVASAAQTSSTPGMELGINASTGGAPHVAQSFEPGSGTSLIYSVNLRLKASGSPFPGALTLHLQTDSAGVPSGTDLASASRTVAEYNSSGSVAAVEYISSNPAYYAFTFRKPVPVTVGTTYWLVLSASYFASDNNLVKWLASDSGPYSDGQSLSGTIGGAWGSPGAGRDMDFVAIGGC